MTARGVREARRARELAAERGASLSSVLSDLVVRGLAQLDEPVVVERDAATGFPILSIGRRLSSADVAALHDHDRVEFWSDDLSYADVDLEAVRGHRPVTDAYLVALARAHGTVLATLDEGLAGAHPGGSILLPSR